MAINFLNPTGFSFILNKTPFLSRTVQTFSVPDVSMGTATVPTPHRDYPETGKMVYSPAFITFKVDENLRNYREIFYWMEELSHPRDYSQYKRERHDLDVMVLSSASRPIIGMTFEDILPVSVSFGDFDTTDTDNTYITGQASFQFTSMRVFPVNSRNPATSMDAPIC